MKDKYLLIAMIVTLLIFYLYCAFVIVLAR